MIGIDTHTSENRRNGMLASILVHLLLLLLCILPMMHVDTEYVDDKVIHISFSDVSDAASSPASAEPVVNESETSAETIEHTAPTSQPTMPVESRPKIASTTVEQEDVQDKSPAEVKTSPSPEDIAKAEAMERERLEREREAAERKKRKEALRKQKSQFGSLFSSKEGSSDKPSESSDGVSETVGDYIRPTNTIGGGLGNRKVVYEPSITDNSQRTGRVVMKICVNNAGIVDYAAYTQKGSTTTDSQLIRKAKEAAVRYRFDTSDRDKQCGTVSFDFKIR